jgi:hypothetical protein
VILSRRARTRNRRGRTLSRRMLVAAVAALVPVLAGCEAGGNAPTLSWHAPTDGAEATVAGISIRDVFVLGAKLNGTLPAGHSASLFFALVNTGSPDQLVSITAPGAAKSVTLPGGSIELAPQQAVLLTGPRPLAVLNGLTRSVPGGTFIRLIMTFRNAGRVTIDAPVMPRAQYYSTFSPPAPAPSSPSPSPNPGPSPTPTPSPTP